MLVIKPKLNASYKLTFMKTEILNCGVFLSKINPSKKSCHFFLYAAPKFSQPFIPPPSLPNPPPNQTFKPFKSGTRIQVMCKTGRSPRSISPGRSLRCHGHKCLPSEQHRLILPARESKTCKPHSQNLQSLLCPTSKPVFNPAPTPLGVG